MNPWPFVVAAYAAAASVAGARRRNNRLIESGIGAFYTVAALMTVAYFDNSKNTPLNPDPSKSLRWGEPSNEEMMGFWLQFADPQLFAEKSSAAQK